MPPIRVSLSPRHYRIEIRFTAPSFTAPNKVRFRHQLEGLDEGWQDTGADRQVTYTHLPPGQYRFRVIACNNDGVWNETGATVALAVLPPWWRNPWMRGLAGLALAGAALGVYLSRVWHLHKAHQMQAAFSQRLIESQEIERKRIAGELHDGVGQELVLIKNRAELGLRRLNPSPSMAEQLQGISASASKALEEVRGTAHALRPPELDRLGLTQALQDMLARAVESSGARFATEMDNLDGLWPADTEINLYRMVQEGLNNILRHARASEVVFEAKKEAGLVRLTLLDNGCGFQPAAERSAGFGLANIVQRATLCGGQVDLQSAPGRGTSLTIRVPLSMKKS